MDALDSWKILIYLLPVALAMLWIRRREAREGVTPFEALTPAQKAWVLLVALPPGASATLMASLPAEAERGYVQSGRALRGSGQNLLGGVVREFAAALPSDWTRGVGRDVDELLGLFTRCAVQRPREMAGRLVALWPAPPVEPEPTPSAEATPLEAEPESAPPAPESRSASAPEAAPAPPPETPQAEGTAPEPRSPGGSPPAGGEQGP